MTDDMLQIEGDDIGARLKAKGVAAVAGGDRGMFLAGQNILNVSNQRVPHEEGDLERDGAVVQDLDAHEVAVTYGRDAQVADYAVKQHEDMEYHHDSGRSAKFLEMAVNQERDTSLAIMQGQIIQAMREG